MTVVVLELGVKKVFASALDWPGWVRSGRSEESSLDALADYRDRYAEVAGEAGLAMPTDEPFEVTERLPGTSTTDFGAPDVMATRERGALSDADAERFAQLVAAAWTVFDRVYASSAPELAKGPRGGGRDRDKMAQHVVNAEFRYARKFGLVLRAPSIDDVAAIAEERAAVVQALRTATGPVDAVAKGWSPAYAARRIAWHVLDHAWEMQDKQP
jgi:hypothetical protein